MSDAIEKVKELPMERQPEVQIDLRGTPCPLNWVKTRLRLEAMKSGELLEVTLDDGEAVQNVPRSVKAEGHRILAVSPLDDGYKVLIERA